MPMATFTFRTTGLMLGPRGRGRRIYSGLLIPFLVGQKKNSDGSHIGEHCLIAQLPGEFSLLTEAIQPFLQSLREYLVENLVISFLSCY